MKHLPSAIYRAIALEVASRWIFAQIYAVTSEKSEIPKGKLVYPTHKERQGPNSAGMWFKFPQVEFHPGQLEPSQRKQWNIPCY